MAYQKFIILSKPRTGSTLLVSKLSSHSKILCYNEIFLKTESQFYFGHEYMEHTVREAFRIRKEDPIKFLDKVIYKQYPHEVEATGFKLHYRQHKYHKGLLEKLQSDTSIKIIHLMRKNMFDSFVSFEKAIQTNKWVNHEEERDNLSLDARLKLDYVKCAEYFEKTENDHNKFNKIFERNEMLEVEYQDLNSRVTEELLMEFLGVEKEVLSSPLEKHPSIPHSESIINYVEIKQKFENTKWSKFFA